MSWLDEVCDGVDFQVSCDCPSGNCVCFGPSTHVVNNATCAGCPDVRAAFALCGFPPYPGPSKAECANASTCRAGDVCCANTAMTTSCMPGPCPSTDPIQLCSTTAECFTAGEACGPLTSPVSIPGVTACSTP
jgi:hypothetical protein